MHIRVSGAWDPAGSSPGALFALRAAGVTRSLRVLQELLRTASDASHPEEEEPTCTGGGCRDDGGRGNKTQDQVYLATDSDELRRAVARLLPADWVLAASPHTAVHTAGAGACGGDAMCSADVARVTVAQHLQVGVGCGRCGLGSVWVGVGVGCGRCGLWCDRSWPLLHPEPKARNPKSQSPNRRPSTLNPQPSTINPKIPNLTP